MNDLAHRSAALALTHKPLLKTTAMKQPPSTSTTPVYYGLGF